MADEQAFAEEIYHIRVRGKLDAKWGDWFGGFVMASRDCGETLLSGAVPDQAALHGVLVRIHSLGLPLLLLAWTGCPCPKKNCPRRGQCYECAAYHGAEGKLPYCFRARTRWDRQCTNLIQERQKERSR
jgi:hypothetical protein